MALKPAVSLLIGNFKKHERRETQTPRDSNVKGSTHKLQGIQTLKEAHTDSKDPDTRECCKVSQRVNSRIGIWTSRFWFLKGPSTTLWLWYFGPPLEAASPPFTFESLGVNPTDRLCPLPLLASPPSQHLFHVKGSTHKPVSLTALWRQWEGGSPVIS